MSNSLSMADKVAVIGRHYRIEFKSSKLSSKIEECKKASGKPTIAEAYDALPATAKKAEQPSQVETGGNTPSRGEAKSGEIIPPNASGPNVAHKVDVGAPSIHVNVPAPVVSVSHGNLSWSHALRQSLLWFNGAIVGAMATAIIFMAGSR